MELALYTQKRISILFVTGWAVWFLCELWYRFNWFNVNHVMFMRGSEPYSLGEMIICSDSFLLLFFMTLVAKSATTQIKWMRYFAGLVQDILLIALVYVFFMNPFIENWNILGWLFISVGLFIFKVVLYKYCKKFREFNVI